MDPFHSPNMLDTLQQYFIHIGFTYHVTNENKCNIAVTLKVYSGSGAAPWEIFIISVGVIIFDRPNFHAWTITKDFI